MTTPKIEIRRVAAERILTLRHRILRAGLPPESARFEDDDAATTLHLAALSTEANAPSEEIVVGCLSLMRNAFKTESAWQLRGMAVAEGLQRHGLGRELLTVGEAAVAAASVVSLLWCNARLPASGFYQNLGWTIESDVFEIPQAGPHVKMCKRIKLANPRETVEKAPVTG